MKTLIASFETLSVYVVVAGALAGTALSALGQFFPIF